MFGTHTFEGSFLGERGEEALQITNTPLPHLLDHLQCAHFATGFPVPMNDF